MGSTIATGTEPTNTGEMVVSATAMAREISRSRRSTRRLL
jgi:hypothetical protein